MMIHRFKLASRAISSATLSRPVAYAHTLSERHVRISGQAATTKNDIILSTVDSCLRFKIFDPELASHALENPLNSVIELIARMTMKTEIGKMTLDETFDKRATLDDKIMIAINEAAKGWGLKCTYFNIRDVTLPANVRKALEMKAVAEIKYRAKILNAEGERLEKINIAEAERQAAIVASEAILASEAARKDHEKINIAEGILPGQEASTKDE